MRKFIAVLLAIIFVFPLIFSALVTLSVTSWVLDRQFYIDILDQEQVYSTLTTGLMIDKMIYNQLNLPLEVNPQELEPIIKEILTPEYSREQIIKFIDTLFDYLQGKTNSFTPTLNIVPLKAALQGDQQDIFLTAFVTALPSCKPGQAPGFVTEGPISCKPDGISDELLIEQVLKPTLPEIISMVPDEIQLEGFFTSFQKTSRWLSFIPGTAIPASIILSLMILTSIAICSWYITALIADPEWRSRLQWLGWMLFIPAGLIFLMGFSDQSGIPAFWIRLGLERVDLSAVPFGVNLGDTLLAIITAALPRIASAFKMVGSIGIGLALALVVWGIATPSRKVNEIS